MEGCVAFCLGWGTGSVGGEKRKRLALAELREVPGRLCCLAGAWVAAGPVPQSRRDPGGPWVSPAGSAPGLCPSRECQEQETAVLRMWRAGPWAAPGACSSPEVPDLWSRGFTALPSRVCGPLRFLGQQLIAFLPAQRLQPGSGCPSKGSPSVGHGCISSPALAGTCPAHPLPSPPSALSLPSQPACASEVESHVFRTPPPPTMYWSA